MQVVPFLTAARLLALNRPMAAGDAEIFRRHRDSDRAAVSQLLFQSEPSAADAFPSPSLLRRSGGPTMGSVARVQPDRWLRR